MLVKDVVDAVERLAPPALAGGWDNTGLIAGDPAWPVEGPVLLTIDLDRAVAREAIDSGAGMVVAYHPPIFRPVARLDAGDARSSALLTLLRAGIAVYSPHSALDAAPEGMADWLLEAVCPARPVERAAIQAPAGDASAVAGPSAREGLVGAGRIATFAEPVALDELARHAARALGVPAVKCAAAGTGPLRRVAVCPGAGSMLFDDAATAGADVFVTGEAGHHDVLAALDRGLSVVLAGHTNTERGFLPLFARQLAPGLSPVPVTVSRADAAPTTVVTVDARER